MKNDEKFDKMDALVEEQGLLLAQLSAAEDPDEIADLQSQLADVESQIASLADVQIDLDI